MDHLKLRPDPEVVNLKLSTESLPNCRRGDELGTLSVHHLHWILFWVQSVQNVQRVSLLLYHPKFTSYNYIMI